MSSYSLFDLPPELILLINSHLQRTDRASFASLNSKLRQVLLSDLFSTITVTSREKDIEILRVVFTKYGKYARRLLFQCYYYFPSSSDSSETPSEQPSNLPADIAQLLSGQRLPAVQALSIEFQAIDKWNDVELLDGPEDQHVILTKERQVPWRRVHFQLWQELSHNTSITSLDIHNLPIAETSAWADPAWKAFLFRQQRLSLGIRGGDNRVGWHSNVDKLYKDFASRLDEFFFDHAANIKHLCVAADSQNPYGAKYQSRGALLALKPDMCPNLETLELESGLLSDNLIEFLKSHAGKLKELRLVECHSCNAPYYGDNPTWQDFFTNILESKPVLEKLQITNSRIPLTTMEEFPLPEELDADRQFIPPENPSEETEETHRHDAIREVRSAVTSSSKRLFSYTVLDDKYGMVFAIPYYNIDRFQEGDDYKAFQDLLSLVKQNAAGRQDSKANSEQSDLQPLVWRKVRPQPEAFVSNGTKLGRKQAVGV